MRGVQRLFLQRGGRPSASARPPACQQAPASFPRPAQPVLAPACLLLTAHLGLPSSRNAWAGGALAPAPAQAAPRASTCSGLHQQPSSSVAGPVLRRAWGFNCRDEGVLPRRAHAARVGNNPDPWGKQRLKPPRWEAAGRGWFGGRGAARPPPAGASSVPRAPLGLTRAEAPPASPGGTVEARLAEAAWVSPG